MRARDNPFATARLEQLPFQIPSGWNRNVLLSRLADLQYRGSIVGPEGSGKTTLLESLQPDLVARAFTPVFLRLNLEHRNIPTNLWTQISSELTARNIILLDGAEQLRRREWQRLVRLSTRVGGLIITCHRPGLLPTLLECITSLELFRTLVNDLAKEPTLVQALPIAEVFQKHQGNIRLALLDLYDVVASS